MEQHNEPIYRTTPARTTKMLVIMLGICIAGGAIFFSFWDYWISLPPGNQMHKAQEGAAPAGQAMTGKEVDVEINFIESPDFKTLAFNALPGEDGHNPDFTVKSGDSVTFTATNAGKSFHAFAVVSDSDDPNTIVFNSAIKSANNPLKPGESGKVTFTAGAPGSYHYICTVPGHAALGMSGNFIVEP